jgi:hypothetical protein
MTARQLDDLTSTLAPFQAARAEQRFYQQRGGPRRQATGNHGRPLLTSADRVLITVVYLRQACSQKVLSEMLEVNPTSIGKAIAETRQLLDEQRCTIEATTLRFTTIKALNSYLAGGAPETTQPRLPQAWALSDPSLTGMTRAELTTLVRRLSVPQAARIERLRHQRRGGERLPGTRGGVFLQKITGAERILAVILYQRGLCTRNVLAQLFHVSPRTIGNAFQEVLPLLEQDGWIPQPGGQRFATATALLESVATPKDTPAS